MSPNPLREMVCHAVLTTIKPQTRQTIPGILDELGMPVASDDPSLTKAQYIESRLELLADHDLPGVAERFLAQHGRSLSAAKRYELNELVWANAPAIEINRRTRYDIARALEGVPLYLKSVPFLSLVAQLWDRSEFLESFFDTGFPSLLAQVERHVVLNEHDWSVEHLFEQLGAYDASSRRFALFLEGLASPGIRPDESSQRSFAATVNGALAGTSIELREVGSEGGFPAFRFKVIGRGAGRAKNLIFASRTKPDLRFRDAVNNDIEIVSDSDQVLVYDLPIPVHGLCWRDLQAWWAELNHLDDKEAKQSLYRRLKFSLPQNSPSQSLLFDTFYRHFHSRVPDLPALLPEVWLHWDPKTVRERGPEALTRHRMDFLMLLPSEVRIVVEVDGLHHYADKSGVGSPDRYALMASADRDLRLAGYDVYRFGAAELDPARGPSLVGDFFERLLKRHGVTA